MLIDRTSKLTLHYILHPKSLNCEYLTISSFFAGNSNSEFQPDRPIGYGAFGVVWSVTDPRDGKRVALKKLPNVFQSLVSSKRVFRELKMMRFFKHENVLSCLDILQVRAFNLGFSQLFIVLLDYSLIFPDATVIRHLYTIPQFK